MISGSAPIARASSAMTVARSGAELRCVRRRTSCSIWPASRWISADAPVISVPTRGATSRSRGAAADPTTCRRSPNQYPSAARTAGGGAAVSPDGRQRVRSRRMQPADGDRARADVVVVGAGIAGLVTALELLNHGRDVVLLDRCHPHELGGLAREAFG